MKKVLMFCTSFFGYENRIAIALREQGYDVDLWDERPSHSFVGKACVRFNAKLYRPVIRRYYDGIISQNQEKEYDYVFVVKGEAVNEEIIGLLRKTYSNAMLILYLWDSVINIPDCEKRMRLYDRVLTFDPHDAQKYGIHYLPIPYDKNSFYFGLQDKYEYDVAFVGTAHSLRPRVIKQLENNCKEQGRTCFVYFYSPHILVYLFNKLTNPDYRWIKLRDVHFTPLSADQVNQIYASSRCVLDVEHPKQQGATTRPVEMLPMKKKIITTNSRVYDFPFYNSNNFCVIDRNDPKVQDSFFDTQYAEVDPEIMEQYSPSRFVEELMGK